MIPNIFFVLFTLSILYFCFGLYTLLINIHSLRNRMFFSLCIHLSAWAFGYAFMVIAPNQDSANFWRMVSAFGWCFVYSVWLDFAIIVKLKSKKWMTDIRRLFIYLPGLFFFIGNFKYQPNKIIIRLNNVWEDVYPLSSFEILYTMYYLVFVIAGIFIIYKWGKNSESKIEKKQSRIMVITALLTFVIVACTDTILPLFSENTFHMGVIIFSISLCGIWYAITKYKMMAINSKVAYEHILRTINDPVILIGKDLLIKEVNNAVLKITGYEEAEIKRSPIHLLVDAAEKNKKTIEILIREGGIKNLEVVLLAKGNNIPCMLSGAAIYNDFDEIIGVACIFNDITEHKNNEKILLQAQQELEMKVFDRTIDLKQINKLLEAEINERKRIEDELKSSEEMFKALMKQSSEGIIVFDAFTLKIFEINETVCKIIDCTEEKLLNLNVNELLPIVNNTNMGVDDYSVQEKFQFKNEITTLSRQDGTIRNIQFSTTVVRYSNKQFIMVTLIDITEKTSMEEKQQQTLKMEALGTLAGGIAHDFNNILAGIIGYTQLSLEEEEEGMASEENLLEVLKLGERAKKLIAKILTFSKKNTIEPHVVDIKVIVEEIIKMLKTTTSTSIGIECNFQVDCAFVFADSGELHQLIMNICVNALLSMQDRGGKLQITLTEFIRNEENKNQYQPITSGKYIKMQFTDNGCGMEKYTMKRIFEPFYTTRGVQGGTGLGLSVVHGIVSRNGGIITVDSIVNEGSTFTVFLPAAKVDSTMEHVRRRTIINSSARILLVDDEESIINTNQKLLQRQGYLVTGVLGGKKALNIFKQNMNFFDIVISDLSMPDMGGDLLIKEIRNIRADIPVILCSGYSHELSDDRINSMDLVEFLLKPISKIEYVNAIEKLIKNRG